MRRADLPDFPWDSLAPYATRARAHPGGIVDLSVGTPVDPTPRVVRDALGSAADSPGYPTTSGTAVLRRAVCTWMARRRGVPGLTEDAVLPTVGSKELVAWLPTLLGLGPGDTVVHPLTAYPTYDVGARLAGARPVGLSWGQLPADDEAVRLVWINSPANPTGQVADVAWLARLVGWAREHHAVLAADECYAELAWGPDPAEPLRGASRPVSLLDPAVAGDDHRGLLVVHSLSKQSNLAGYRAGFLAGDPRLVADILQVRRHAGMIVPGPVQAAMVAALGDDRPVEQQRVRYAARRAVLWAALVDAGLHIEESAGGLYLWATRGEACWDTVGWLADRGVLVAPGAFYGPAGSRHVRVALTAADERIAAAVARLTRS
ncbi:MAG: succinyldiaminopimelate transaminase [Actinomycetes bacterium]